MALAQTERAQEIADELLGTASNLSDVLTRHELEDQELLDEVDTHVRECVTCGWWVEADEVDDAGDCDECQDKESDS